MRQEKQVLEKDEDFHILNGKCMWAHTQQARGHMAEGAQEGGPIIRKKKQTTCAMIRKEERT